MRVEATEAGGVFGQPPPRHNGLAPRRHRARPYSRKTVLTRHLGAGSCGSVYVGMCGDEEVAVKVRRDAAEMRPEMRPQMRPRCGPRWGRDVAEIGADTAKIANGYLSRHEQVQPLEAETAEDIKREIRILRECDCEHIVAYKAPHSEM